ncbi:MAG: Na+/H+ antiporter [Caulobacterales bacterium 32-69-10]|nr:MAG: Na+/H+ antiporter [Caulobacterales bacterium 32-69-10]
MEEITVVLTLLAAVVVSGVAARATRMALPLMQILIGAAIGWSPLLRTTVLDPELFFVLFLPPLLFLDGWRIPKRDLFRDRAIIVELALGLVVLTVVGVGLLIHLLIPATPLPVAFAIAAIVSPTDPIAVSAVAARTPIPKRMMHILEGESLLNDASGLVCMRFAVAAMLTGSFSLVGAAATFLWVALAGLAIGAATAWAITRVKASDGGQAMAITRVRRTAVWDTVQFAANGAIFVLLGEQLPTILDGASETVRMTGHTEPWWLAVYVLIIVTALVALRFGWVWASLRLTWFKAALTGAPRPKTSLRLVLAMSMAGVRGAITLAGILTLPLALNDGTPFPARDLAIFLAAGVILVTLLLATFILPRVLKTLELPPEPSQDAAVEHVRQAAAEAAIQAVEAMHNQHPEAREDAHLYADAASRVTDLYRLRVDGRLPGVEDTELQRRTDEIEGRLRVAALRAERAAVFDAARRGDIDESAAARLVREIDLLETRYAT